MLVLKKSDLMYVYFFAVFTVIYCNNANFLKEIGSGMHRVIRSERGG
jgi:hypothetical protein